MKLWRTPLDADKVRVPHGVVKIIIERCKGCSFCVEYCPRDVLQISRKFNKKGYHYPEVMAEALCVDCNLCEDICPEFAIFSIPAEDIMTAPPVKSAEASKKKTPTAALKETA
jgi:2-oxoglutarate ferredoxin oxidoreductase subunit delta